MLLKTGIKMEEIWKDIEGYNGRYQVSNLGRVKSIITKGRYEYNPPKVSILSGTIARGGYKRVLLTKNGKKTAESVHRLVAKAFIPNPENKPQINHIDGNKLNNCVDNLEWVTHQENQAHAWDNGLKQPFRGEDHPNSKLSEDTVSRIRGMDRDTDYSHREIAEEFGLRRRLVTSIINKKAWAHV